MEYLDETDLALLNHLQKDSRLSTRELAKRIGKSFVTVNKRLSKLEKKDIIKRYSVVVDYNKIKKYKTLVYVLIQVDGIRDPMKILRDVSDIPEITEVHAIAGEDNVIAKMRGEDTAAIGKLVMEQLYHIKGVGRTKTIFVLHSEKEDGLLDLL